MKRNRHQNGFCISLASRLNLGSKAVFSCAATIAKLSCVLLLAAGCAHTAATVPIKPPISPAPKPRVADFENEPRSNNAQHVADWVVNSDDNHAMPFLIIDKTDAKAFLFEPGGHLLGEAPCLVGLKKGDVCPPGMGKKKLWQIGPSERITPAGRFEAFLGRDLKGKTVLWVDYKGGVALHWVVTNNPKERRLERIASPNPAEHRISYGCINVPNNFYSDLIKPTFAGKRGVVYVLPEVETNKEAFKSYYRVEIEDKSAAR
jgi:hypothetical protein